MFSSFPASENNMESLTQSFSPFATYSIVSSQSDEIAASWSLTPSAALSLATSASAVAELTIQSGFFSFSSSSYLSQGASSSISESLTFFIMSQSIFFQEVNQQSRKGCRSFLKARQKVSNDMLWSWWEAIIEIIIRNQFDHWPPGSEEGTCIETEWSFTAYFPNPDPIYGQNLRFCLPIYDVTKRLIYYLWPIRLVQMR